MYGIAANYGTAETLQDPAELGNSSERDTRQEP